MMSTINNVEASADELWATLEHRGFAPMFDRLSVSIVRVSWWRDGCRIAAYFSPTGRPSRRIRNDASGTFARFFTVDSRGFVHYESESRLLGGTFTDPNTVLASE